MNEQHSTTNGAENHHNPTLVPSPYPEHKDKYFQCAKSNRFSKNSSNRKGKKSEKSSTLKGEDFFDFFSFNDSKQQSSIQNQHVKDKFELERIQNSIFAILRKRLALLKLQKPNCDEIEIEEDIEISAEITKLEKQLDVLNGCGTNFIGGHHLGGQKNGTDNFMAMTLYCGNVMCSNCNKKDSSIHKRKSARARWLSDAFPDTAFGYMVFTVPLELRKHFTCRNQLNALFNAGIEVMKDILSPIGMMATLHFFGDKEDGFHPHLNILFPREDSSGTKLRMLLPKSTLKKIRQAFMLKLLELVPVEAKNKFVYKNPNYLESKSNSHYKFKKETGQKLHAIKYCVRGVDVEKLADETPKVFDLFLQLSGFRNVRWYGQFSNSLKGKFLENRNVVLANDSGFADEITILPVSVGEKRAKMFNFMDNPEIGTDVDYPIYPQVDLQTHWDWLNQSHEQLVKSLTSTYGRAVKIPHVASRLVDWADTYQSLVKTSRCISDGPLLAFANEKLVELLRVEVGG